MYSDMHELIYLCKFLSSLNRIKNKERRYIEKSEIKLTALRFQTDRRDMYICIYQNHRPPFGGQNKEAEEETNEGRRRRGRGHHHRAGPSQEAEKI